VRRRAHPRSERRKRKLVKHRILALRIGFLLSAGWIAAEATARDTAPRSSQCDSRFGCSSGALAGGPLAAAQVAEPLSMPAFLGAQIFYDNGFLGDSVVLAIVDRGWVDARVYGLDAPGKVTEFLSWVGSPDSGLRVRTSHETVVAAAAAPQIVPTTGWEWHLRPRSGRLASSHTLDSRGLPRPILPSTD
jgi:hypothetical protein